MKKKLENLSNSKLLVMLKLKGKRKIDGRNTEKTSAYVVATP